MKRTWFIAFLAYVLLCAAGEATIPLNSLQTFDTLPDPASWATRTNGGIPISFTNVATMDATAQTNDISTLTNVLPVTATEGTSQVARWNSAARNVLTRAGFGSGYISLLATVQNTSGKDLSSVVIAYDFGNPIPLAQSEDPGLNGLRAYYSLTGQPNSWSLIPEFTTGQTGSLAAAIMLGAWPQNGLLYLLWVDDNGSPAGDGAFIIDNFIALESLPPPPPPRIDPPGTNILERQRIQLTVFATGYGLSYQWLKDRLPISPVTNPTASQRALLITNAQPSDSGSYSVLIANISGAVTSQPVAVVVFEDTTPPSFVRAWEDPFDLQKFHLIVSEELCNDEAACGGQADMPFNWQIQDLSIPDDFMFAFPESINGTNLTLVTPGPRTPGRRYRIVLDPDAMVTDLEGNSMLSGSSVTVDLVALFQQGVNTYAGTHDTELRGAAPGVPQGTNEVLIVDAENLGTVSQALLRFDGLFGSALGQIPMGASIHSAALRLTVADPAANIITLHRMLVPWDEATASFDLFGSGIQAEGVEAQVAADGTLLASYQFSVGATMEVDVTSSVQAWAEGQANLGWVQRPTSSDGFGFYSSESANPPSLAIAYDLIIVDPCDFSIQQQPAPTITFREDDPLLLSVRVNTAGLCLLDLQWTKDGVDIPGATSSSYLVNFAGYCDVGTYRVRISDGQLHSVISNPAVVTMSPDIVVPELAKAFASDSGTNITLYFSRQMDKGTATNLSNYVLDPPAAITSVTIGADHRVVMLTTEQYSPLLHRTLRVQNLRAERWSCGGGIGNMVVPNPTIVELTGVQIDLPWNASWFYSTNSQNATLSTPSPWYATDFPLPPDWRVGSGLFGTATSPGVVSRLPSPVLTPIPPGQGTRYFRKVVDLPPLPPGAIRILRHFMNDGAVFYLDGMEMGRINMTNPPPILYGDRASAPIAAVLRSIPFTASPGPHTLAVEVHPWTFVPDIVFGLQLAAFTQVPRLAVDSFTISWNGDSRWELLSSANVMGPYAPVPVDPWGRLGKHYELPTNSASFFRLRFKEGLPY